MTNAIDANYARLVQLKADAEALYQWAAGLTVVTAPQPPAPKHRLQIAPTEVSDPTFDLVANAEQQVDAMVARLLDTHLLVASAARARGLPIFQVAQVPCWTHPAWQPALASMMRATVEGCAGLHHFYSDSYRKLSSTDEGGEWVHGAGQVVVDVAREVTNLRRRYVPPDSPPRRQGCQPPWCRRPVEYPGVSGGLCRTHYMQHYRRRQRRKAKRGG